MTAPALATFSPRRVWPLAAALVLTVLVPRLLAFPLLDLGPDEIAYAVIGRDLMAGQWPYTTAFDHKPVGLYVPFGLAQLGFGQTTTSLRVLSLVVAAVSCWLVYAWCRRLGLQAGGAAALAGVFSLMGLGNDGLAALSEPLLNLYVLAMLLVLKLPRGWPSGLAFGALMGLAVNTNYLIGPVVAVIGLYFLLRPGRVTRDKVGAVIGFVATTAALLVPLVLYSDIGDYFALQSSFLGGYAMPPVTWDIVLVRAQRFLTPTFFVLLLPVLALVLHGGGRAMARRLAWPMALLVVTVAAASYSGYFWPHYSLIIAPAVVLVTAIAVTTIDRAAARATFLAAVVVVACWAVVVPVLPKLVAGATSIATQHNLAPDRGAPESRVAAALREVVRPGEVIYSLDLHDYLLSQASTPTRFFFPGQHLDPAFAASRGTTPEQQVADILARSPRAVVTSTKRPWPRPVAALVEAYVDDRCRVVATVDSSTVHACPAP